MTLQIIHEEACVAANNPFSVPKSDLTLVGHPPFSLTTSKYDFATTSGLLFDLQPQHLAAKTIDTCVDWESMRFQFVISVDMPAVAWTCVHVSPPLQSMPASHFTTVGIHFLQQSLNQIPAWELHSPLFSKCATCFCNLTNNQAHLSPVVFFA